MLLIITSALLIKAAQAACYWANTTEVDTGSGLRECKGLSSIGTCCVGNDACLSTGLCMSGQGFFYQGGCTTPGWSSSTPSCFAKCATSPGITFAPLSICDGAKLCCGWSGETYPSDCCTNSAEGFTFDGATFLGPVQAPLFSNIVESVKKSYAGATVTKTGNGATDAAQADTQCSANGYVKNSTAIGVGVGLGVALLLAIAAIAWLCIKTRRNSSNHSHTQERSYREPTQQSPLMSNEKPRAEIQGNGITEMCSHMHGREVSELASGYPRSPAR